MVVSLARCTRPKLLILLDMLLGRRKHAASTPATFCSFADISPDALELVERWAGWGQGARGGGCLAGGRCCRGRRWEQAGAGALATRWNAQGRASPIRLAGPCRAGRQPCTRAFILQPCPALCRAAAVTTGPALCTWAAPTQRRCTRPVRCVRGGEGGGGQRLLGVCLLFSTQVCRACELAGCRQPRSALSRATRSRAAAGRKLGDGSAASLLALQPACAAVAWVSRRVVPATLTLPRRPGSPTLPHVAPTCCSLPHVASARPLPAGKLIFLRPFKGRRAGQTVWDAVWIEASSECAPQAAGGALGSCCGACRHRRPTGTCGAPRPPLSVRGPPIPSLCDRWLVLRTALRPPAAGPLPSSPPPQPPPIHPRASRALPPVPQP